MTEVYHEVQARPPWWAVAVVVVAAVDVWVLFLLRVVFNQNEAPLWLTWALLLLVGVGLPAFMVANRLIITVTETDVRVQFVPLADVRYPYEQIRAVERRTYSAIREYGGWGLRTGWGSKRAFNMRGHEGVELTLTDGSKIMLGSENAAELESVIRARLR